MRRDNATRRETTRHVRRARPKDLTYCAVYKEGAQDNDAQQNRAGRSHHLQQIISLVHSRAAEFVNSRRWDAENRTRVNKIRVRRAEDLLPSDAGRNHICQKLTSIYPTVYTGRRLLTHQSFRFSSFVDPRGSPLPAHFCIPRHPKFASSLLQTFLDIYFNLSLV